MSSFILHDALARLTLVADWPLNLILLENDRRFPWLVMVPKRTELRDLHDLTPADRHVCMTEVCAASAALLAGFGARKMNVAALGNQVPQLHIHVIARWPSDAAWPGPVWLAGPAEPYDDAGRAARVAEMQTMLADAL
ncbi:MAG: HIT family protein [Alphaproteobacteria bacterium]